MALGEAVDQRSGVKRKRKAARPHKVRRRVITAGVVLVVLIAGIGGGSYIYANWEYHDIPKITVTNEQHELPGKPFNILLVGSDSRVGLTGSLANETGANLDTVFGQRSDLLKVVHVDPGNKTISMLSIPRDTMVTLLANHSLYGQYNRINVNFGAGPSLLVQTITANFGIPINYTVVVSFAGLINIADALGGVYLRFPYPSRDPESGLNIRFPGCQKIVGLQALGLTRSRHMYYNTKGSHVWPSNYQD